MNGTNGSPMMHNKPVDNSETGGADHCGDANSDMGSMMNTGATMKAMM